MLKIIKEKYLIYLFLFISIAIFFVFGSYHLTKFITADEHYWIYERVPQYWNAIFKADFLKTFINDKPGVTVALVSGVGLLFEKNPKQFKNIKWQGEVYNANVNKMESFNVKFRLPLFIFTILMLPFFYWLLKIIFGKIPALSGVIFIGLSPILIGTARIINPDGILWIFTSLSIFSYFAYLKEKNKKYLYFSALMLGLGILTKYTANILYIFFFVMIFAEYVFNYKKYTDQKFSEYLKISLLDYAKLALVSLMVFYVFYPAVWEKPNRLLIGTIYSQAFAPAWPFFASLITITLLDLFILKGIVMSFVMNKISAMRKWIFAGILTVFLAATFTVIANTYLGMKFYDFELILSSPKSSYSLFGPMGIFLANFYPRRPTQ